MLNHCKQVAPPGSDFKFVELIFSRALTLRGIYIGSVAQSVPSSHPYVHTYADPTLQVQGYEQVDRCQPREDEACHRQGLPI